ncbi:hypothetical protein N7468_008042 [Penicillium chermesinum]|uniref:MARVEL domain-containing protein n=1 Tax=Penicillium chermesinum TaxID=63820 RepID=A0A9W9NP60_9EURO|nr:uncharacterized protein N7468_008042 [Penicillium chermesinum]KAJ5223500.1 hypothetical protein N7468_008042 [Penicillium chermesinum]
MPLPRLSGGNLGRTKNIIHFSQAFIIFIAWALTIAIWTKGGGVDGRTVFYWVLCWISVPGLIYLTAVPMWPRARRFGNVYAFATVDILYAIFWFSAWVCLASYVAQGKSLGKSTTDSKDSDKSSTKTSRSADKTIRAAQSTTSSPPSGCDNWHYGDSTKCKLSTATTIIGVIILHPPRCCLRPNLRRPSKAAFSSNPAHDFEEDEEDFRSGRAGMGSSINDRDEDYALLQQSEADDMGSHAGRSALHGAYDPTESGGSVMHDYNSTGYGGAHGQHYVPPSEQYTPSDYGSTMFGRER